MRSRLGGAGATLVGAGLLGAGLISAGLGAIPPTAQPAADVVLITIDTLRPDALGWIGGGTHTPVLDAVAHRSVRFRSVVSPAPLTAPAHASLLTGLEPPRHGLRVNGDALRRSGFSLASRLSQRGWATGAFVSGYPLRRMFGLNEGFDHYDDEFAVDAAGNWADRDAAVTSSRALGWIAKQQAPVFVWIHYYDAHEPYEPPAEFRLPGVHGDYLGEVAKIDRAIGRLLAELDRLRGTRPRLLVVTADHGEALGEHGEATHGFFVYDSTLLVPLMMSFPERLTPRLLSQTPRLVDLAPTVEGLVGLERLAGRDGVDLGLMLQGKAHPDLPPAWIESLEPLRGYGWAPLTGIRSAGYKLIASPRPELYDLVDDSGEVINIVDSRRRIARELEVVHRDRSAPGQLSPAAASKGSSEDRSALAALGYLGGGPQGVTPQRGLADPKDRLEAKLDLDRAEQAYQAGRLEVAAAAWLSALARDPGNPLAEQRLATLAGARGDYREAVTRLERARLRAPDNGEIAYQWADALSHNGAAGAVVAWRRVTEMQPWRAVAWANLGTLLVQQRDIAGALVALEEAARLAPEDASIQRNLSIVRQQANQRRELQPK